MAQRALAPAFFVVAFAGAFLAGVAAEAAGHAARALVFGIGVASSVVPVPRPPARFFVALVFVAVAIAMPPMSLGIVAAGQSPALA